MVFIDGEKVLRFLVRPERAPVLVVLTVGRLAELRSLFRTASLALSASAVLASAYSMELNSNKQETIVADFSNDARNSSILSMILLATSESFWILTFCSICSFVCLAVNLSN